MTVVEPEFGFFQVQVEGVPRHTIELHQASLGVTPEAFKREMGVREGNWGQNHYCPEISENRQNCSLGCPPCSVSWICPSSCCSGVISNRDKLRTCMMACIEADKAKRFLIMATKT